MANADATSSNPRARKGTGDTSKIEIDVSRVKQHLYAALDEAFDIRALGNSAMALLDPGGEIDKEDQENISRLVNMMLGSVGNILTCFNAAEEALFELKGGAT